MNTDELCFRATDEPAEGDLERVDSGLEEYNAAAAPIGEVARLAAFATEPSGRVVAGAAGRTWGKCCELLQLWVAPEYRANRVGSRLLQEVEERARARGCTVFYLTTLSFQAPGFYRKHGYAVLAEITGYPDGIAKYLMHKTGS